MVRAARDATAAWKLIVLRVEIFKKLGDFTVAAFAENIGDRRAVTFGYQDFGTGSTRFIVKPRTLGVQVNWAM